MGKVFWPWERARAEMVLQSAPLLGSLLILELSDSNYYLAPDADIQAEIHAARINELQYVEELSDCDDFNRKLQTHFLDAAYKYTEGTRIKRPPFLFGLAESIDHAMNFYFADDGRMRILEPQTNEVFWPKDVEAYIQVFRV